MDDYDAFDQVLPFQDMTIEAGTQMIAELSKSQGIQNISIYNSNEGIRLRIEM